MNQNFLIPFASMAQFTVELDNFFQKLKNNHTFQIFIYDTENEINNRKRRDLDLNKHFFWKVTKYVASCSRFHRRFASFTFAGPSTIIEIPLWQQRNPEKCNIFQSNWIEFHIKLVIPSYSFPPKGLHVRYICSFYSVTKTTSRNPGRESAW
jgi:hypothetical protein